jgi:hypothetical protein
MYNDYITTARCIMITTAQQECLMANGYRVEDIELEYGPEFKGQWRWLHKSGQFQDADTSSSSVDAWYDAWLHYEIFKDSSC